MYYLLGYRLMDRPISHDRKATIAENTYLLTLDGDIDFRPSAVKVLVDLMKRNKELGAACGRIHPMGTGNNLLINNFPINNFLTTNSLMNTFLRNSLLTNN